jgi:hypothetical protein
MIVGGLKGCSRVIQEDEGLEQATMRDHGERGAGEDVKSDARVRGHAPAEGPFTGGGVKERGAGPDVSGRQQESEMDSAQFQGLLSEVMKMSQNHHFPRGVCDRFTVQADAHIHSKCRGQRRHPCDNGPRTTPMPPLPQWIRALDLGSEPSRHSSLPSSAGPAPASPIAPSDDSDFEQSSIARGSTHVLTRRLHPTQVTRGLAVSKRDAASSPPPGSGGLSEPEEEMRRLQMLALQAQQQRDMAELKIAQLLSSSSSSWRPPATPGIDLSDAHRQRMRKLGFTPPQGDTPYAGGSDPAAGPVKRVGLAASSPLAQASADLYRSHVQLILGGVDAARDRAATSLSSQGQHMVRMPFSPAPLLQRAKFTSQTHIQAHQNM